MTRPDVRPPLTWPLCRGQDFEQQESRQDSRWGSTSHVMLLTICRRCDHVRHFWGGNSVFDVD